MCIIEAVQQHINTIWCGFNRETLRVSAVFAVIPCPFVRLICPSVCHVGGSYCQTSFRPDCPIIRIFHLQRRYRIPRETLSSVEGAKILGQWENSVIFD